MRLAGSRGGRTGALPRAAWCWWKAYGEGDSGLGQRLRRRGQDTLRHLRKELADHHGWYDASVLAQLPLSGGATPEQLVSLVESSTWGAARVVRLRDVEWGGGTPFVAHSPGPRPRRSTAFRGGGPLSLGRP